MAIPTRAIAQVLQGGETVARKVASSLPEDLGEVITGYHGTDRAFDQFLSPELIKDRNWQRPNVWLGTHFTTEEAGARAAIGGAHFDVEGRVIEAQLRVGKTLEFGDEKDLDRAIATMASERGWVSHAEAFGETLWDAPLMRRQAEEAVAYAREAVGWDGPEKLVVRERELADLLSGRGADPGSVHQYLLSSDAAGASDLQRAKAREVGLAYRAELQEQGYGSVAFGHPHGRTIVPFDVGQIDMGTREAVQAVSTPVTAFHATANAFDEFTDPALIDEMAKTYGGHADAYVGTYFLEKKESAQFFFEGKGWPDLVKEKKRAAKGLAEGQQWLSDNVADLEKAEAIPDLLRRYAPATRDALSPEEQRLAGILWSASASRSQVRTGERVAERMVGKDPRVIEASLTSLNPKVFENRGRLLEDMEEFSGVPRLDGGAVDEDMAQIGLAYRRNLQGQGFDSVRLESYEYGGPRSSAIIAFETSQIQIKGQKARAARVTKPAPMSSARRAHLERTSRPGFIDDPARLDPVNFG